MNMDGSSRRLSAAKAGRDYLAGAVSYEKIQQEFGEDEDELIGDLVSYIEHELGPPIKLFWGLEFGSRKDWENSRLKIEKAVCALETPGKV